MSVDTSPIVGASYVLDFGGWSAYEVTVLSVNDGAVHVSAHIDGMDVEARIPWIEIRRLERL